MIDGKIGERGDVKFENNRAVFWTYTAKNLNEKYKIFHGIYRITDSIPNILRSAASLIRYRRGFHYCYSRPAVV